MDEYVNQFDSCQMVLERKKQSQESRVSSNKQTITSKTTADAVGEFG